MSEVFFCAQRAQFSFFFFSQGSVSNIKVSFQPFSALTPLSLCVLIFIVSLCFVPVECSPLLRFSSVLHPVLKNTLYPSISLAGQKGASFVLSGSGRKWH